MLPSKTSASVSSILVPRTPAVEVEVTESNFYPRDIRNNQKQYCCYPLKFVPNKDGKDLTVAQKIKLSETCLSLNLNIPPSICFDLIPADEMYSCADECMTEDKSFYWNLGGIQCERTNLHTANISIKQITLQLNPNLFDPTIFPDFALPLVVYNQLQNASLLFEHASPEFYFRFNGVSIPNGFFSTDETEKKLTAELCQLLSYVSEIKLAKENYPKLFLHSTQLQQPQENKYRTIFYKHFCVPLCGCLTELESMNFIEPNTGLRTSIYNLLKPFLVQNESVQDAIRIVNEYASSIN